MTLRVLKQRREHDRQNHFDIIADEVAKVFVIPEIQGTLGDLAKVLAVEGNSWKRGSMTNLEVRTGNTLGQLVEQWLLDLGKLGGVHHLKNILHLV